MSYIFTYLDMPRNWQINFQDPATAIMEGIIDLHNTIFFFLIIITILVFYMFFVILRSFSYQWGNLLDKFSYWVMVNNKPAFIKKHFNWLILSQINKNLISQRINHNSNLEIIWVILPAIVLVFIAIPSFTILYTMDEVFNSPIIIRVIGHQWYWSYEFTIITTYDIDDSLRYYTLQWPSNDALCFDPLSLKKWYKDEWTIRWVLAHRFWAWGQSVRLLAADYSILVPSHLHIQFLVTSDDVIHSWAVPALGVKIDCVPGRLNQVSVFIKRPGIFFGQCSEICGINHGFMPITIVAIPLELYFWERFYYSVV